jgi:hypothetical protein
VTPEGERPPAIDAAAGEGDPSPRWRLAIERALGLARRAGRALENAPPSGADLDPGARAIDAAIDALHAAVDGRGDRLDLVRSAEAELDAAASVLGMLAVVDEAFPVAATWLNEAQEALVVAEEHFVHLPFQAPPPPTPLRASKEVPALHTLEREPIAARLRVAAPLPPPREELPPIAPPGSLAELGAAMAEVERRSKARRDERKAREAARQALAAKKRAPLPDPPPGFARGLFTAKSEDAQRLARTRECFEEVAMIGAQRAPLLGDPFRSASFLEDRMLAAIDAVAALGGRALQAIEPLVLDAPAPDAARAFAAVMILGCFAGRDTLGAVERLFFQLGPADPAVAAGIRGALCLVPHPELPAMLRSLLADPDPACRALAIEVLAYRGFASLAELSAAVRDPAPEVVTAALPALALLGGPRAPGLDEALALAADHDEPRLREAAWAAMTYADHPRTRETLEAALDGPHAARAAIPLALAGEAADAARLLERLRRTPTSSLVNAVGWSGTVEAIVPLIDLLEHDDPTLQLGAAYALDRITGARLVDEVEVPPELISAPDVPEPEVGEPRPRPLAHLVSDPRDRPSEGASDTLRQPTIRADRWRAHWLDKGDDYRVALRYRRGSPFAPTLSLWELDAWPLTPGERRWLQRELIVRTGQVVRFDPHDFVKVQEASLDAWAPIAQRMSGQAGSWHRPMRR